MPVVLTLPTTSPDPYIDAVRVYRRQDAFSYTLVSEVALGTPTLEDPLGVVGDEYHSTFYSTALDLESLPSDLVRITTHWESLMGATFELQTTSPDPNVDTVAIYCKRGDGADCCFVRVGTVPLGTQYFTDPDALPGDICYTTFINSTTLAESQPSPCVTVTTDGNQVIVSGYAVRIDGRPVTDPGSGSDAALGCGAHVHVTLYWPARHITPSAFGLSVIRETKMVPIGEDGKWSTPLVPNDLLQSPKSYYEFKFTDGVKYFKRINSVNGDIQNFALLGDVDPLELR
jgi:hypothetical protein